MMEKSKIYGVGQEEPVKFQEIVQNSRTMQVVRVSRDVLHDAVGLLQTADTMRFRGNDPGVKTVTIEMEDGGSLTIR